jgi:hypothetical protein
VPRPDRLARAADGLARGLASGTTRGSFLAKVGGLALALTGARAVTGSAAPLPGTEPVGPWYGFCGHFYTTASCPGPYDLPRVDGDGLPLRPEDGRPVDNLGRLVDADGWPVGEDGVPIVLPTGERLPRAPRSRMCEDWIPESFGVDAVTEGAWYRCCNGQIRKLSDCCSTSSRRINGDGSLRGYCSAGRGVFCVMYVETGVPC